MTYLDWKLSYLKANGMLGPSLLAQDINEMCRLIDQASSDEESADNFAMNECLAFISHTLMPVLKHDDHQHLLSEPHLQDALVNLIDIITLRCKFARIVDRLFRVTDQAEAHQETRS